MKYLGLFIIVLVGLGSCTDPIQPTWAEVSTPVTTKLQAMAHAEDSSFWLVGGLQYGEESLLSSVDGQDWVKQEATFGQTLFDACFSSAQEGLLCGISGKVLRSKDGGENWNLYQLPYWLPMRSIISQDSISLCVGGIAYDRGIIFRSQDHGLSWTLIDTPEVELRDVIFTDQQTAYACGFGTVMKSVDAGLTWEVLDVKGEFFSALAFSTPQIGFAVGRTGSIMRSLDAGESWETLRNGDALGKSLHFYNDIVFWDSETGYIVGDKGLVLQTTDGGENWIRMENESTNDLFGILLQSAHSGYVVGDNGTVLQFNL